MFQPNVRFACCNLDERLIKAAWKGGAPVCLACEDRALKLLSITPPER
jgi:hypothetical protein